MSNQQYNSANTSINKTKLPAIYNKIDWEKLRKNWYNNHNYMPYVYDYGCGRYTNHIRKFLEEKGFEYVGYDPYWRSEGKWLRKNPPAVVICSNVLNVIAEDNIVKEIIKKLQSYKQPYFITVYEGNGSGIGAVSQKNCYQRNLKTASYRFFYEYKGFAIKKSVITDEKYKKYLK